MSDDGMLVFVTVSLCVTTLVCAILLWSVANHAVRAWTMVQFARLEVKRMREQNEHDWLRLETAESGLEVDEADWWK